MGRTRNSSGKNQHKPCPPDDLIKDHLCLYFSIGRSDVEIVDLLKSHYDTQRYGMRSVISAHFHETEEGEDQHDKWGPRFGLWFHNSLDATSAWNNWLKVWWTNSNPRLIAKYFLDCCCEMKGVPVMTQSDPGTENNGVANIQTTIRHRLDPSLCDTLQHRFMRKKNNVKSEANWSIFRHDFAPGFETILEGGSFSSPSTTEFAFSTVSLVFRWLAIPWIQAELDS
ncbi:hypothetical protein K443DRAFT_27227, partial [Laccaria amethystina LaAM-08-1]